MCERDDEEEERFRDIRLFRRADISDDENEREEHEKVNDDKESAKRIEIIKRFYDILVSLFCLRGRGQL